jgi:hypothetical protein
MVVDLTWKEGGIMGYISSFTYCDSIQTEMTPQGPRDQIVIPLQVLAPIAIPGNYSFAISCNIAGFDATKENSIRIQFVSPSEQIVNDTGEVKFQLPSEQVQSDKPSVMQFNLDMRNLVLREVGIHSTKVFLNEVPIGEYKIEVIVGDES